MTVPTVDNPGYEYIGDMVESTVEAIITLLLAIWNDLIGGVISALLDMTFGSGHGGAGWAVMCVLLITLLSIYVARHNGYLEGFSFRR